MGREKPYCQAGFRLVGVALQSVFSLFVFFARQNIGWLRLPYNQCFLGFVFFGFSFYCQAGYRFVEVALQSVELLLLVFCHIA